MANTHIIIPIKDIEDEINTLFSDPIFKQIKRDIEQNNGISPQQKNKRNLLLQRIEGLQWILDNGKQISLDEKDIEKAGDEYQNRKGVSRDLIPSVGYKQALKDLL